MPPTSAAALAPLLSGYKIGVSPTKTISVPKATKLASLQDITANGTLLKKQSAKIQGNRHIFSPTSTGYHIETDGDLHFCLGSKPGQAHIPCELQNAKAWLSKFVGAIGKPIIVSGFFRCLFEHPGFNPKDDAHIFEIHPVRAVSVGGQIQSFNIDVPEQRAIHTWTNPRSLNKQDQRVKVRYDKNSDTLNFTGMDGQDENYVRETGTVSQAKPNATGQSPASFTFTSQDIGHPVQAYCLQGTTAARQLRQLKKTKVELTGLRNIDLQQAKKNRYVINLLGVYIKEL